MHPTNTRARLEPQRPRTWKRSLAATATAAVALTAAFTAFAAPANAAEIPGAIHNVKITSTSDDGLYYPNQEVKLTADWSVPDRSPAGSTFSMAVPTQLVGLGVSFPLLSSGGATVGNCAVTAASLDCTLTDYVTSHPLNIKGTITLSAKLSQTLPPGNNDINLIVNGVATPVPVVVEPGEAPGPPGPYVNHPFAKWGGLSDDGKTISWWVNLPNPAAGFAKDIDNLVFADQLSAGQHYDVDSITLFDAAGLNTAGTDPLWVAQPQDSLKAFTTTPNSFSITLDAKKGHYYALWYQTVVEDGATGPWTNQATLKGGGVDAGPIDWQVNSHSASGTGDGDGAVSVGDYVWVDENRDGLQDSTDTPIPGVVLVVTSPDGEPVTDVHGDPVGPATSDKTGHYSFDDLPILDAGEQYTVTIDKDASTDEVTTLTPTEEHASPRDVATDSSNWSEVSTGLTANGERDDTLDFGFTRAAVTPPAVVTPPAAPQTPPAPPATTPPTTAPKTPAAAPKSPSLAETGVSFFEPGLIGAAALLMLGAFGAMAARRRAIRSGE